MEENQKFLTAQRAFWAHVYFFYSVGLCGVLTGGYLAYKQFWLGKTTVLIGTVDSYDDGSIDEGKVFTRKKG